MEGNASRSRSGLVGAIKRTVLLAAAVVVAINIWTGGPLLALWIGAQLQGDTGLSMGVVLAVLLILVAIVTLLTIALGWLNARYDELVGRPPPRRQPYPWLRSMRAERETEVRRGQGVSAVEKAIIASVVLAVLAFEVWFFFFAEVTFPGG